MAETSLPEPKEDYQKKLKAFLSDILPEKEIVSGTPALQSPFKQADIDALKGIKTDPLFRKYTGWEHKSLLQKWLVDKTTTCNEFCQKCAIAMGYTAQDGVGRFDIADWLNRMGLGHVWVPASSNSTPEYGDIFRLFGPNPDQNGTSLNHMAVSLHVVGDDWYTVESGQGGPSRGFDAIKRRKRSWKPDALRGWVSMKALLNAGQPLPYWLGGWWQVEEGPYETYHYYFASGGKVTCLSSKPPSITAPPASSGALVGNFAMKGMFGVQISWSSADVDETLTVVVQEQKKRRYVMEGRTARGAKLVATRLLPPDAFG